VVIVPSCSLPEGSDHDHVDLCYRAGRRDERASTAAVERVQARIDNLLTTADRFDHPGGSRALARRARDKAAGMETALRLLSTPGADER
jgi:hypothetical protein